MAAPNYTPLRQVSPVARAAHAAMRARAAGATEGRAVRVGMAAALAGARPRPRGYASGGRTYTDYSGDISRYGINGGEHKYFSDQPLVNLVPPDQMQTPARQFQVSDSGKQSSTANAVSNLAGLAAAAYIGSKLMDKLKGTPAASTLGKGIVWNQPAAATTAAADAAPAASQGAAGSAFDPQSFGGDWMSFDTGAPSVVADAAPAATDVAATSGEDVAQTIGDAFDNSGGDWFSSEGGDVLDSLFARGGKVKRRFAAGGQTYTPYSGSLATYGGGPEALYFSPYVSGATYGATTDAGATPGVSRGFTVTPSGLRGSSDGGPGGTGDSSGPTGNTGTVSSGTTNSFGGLISGLAFGLGTISGGPLAGPAFAYGLSTAQNGMPGSFAKDAGNFISNNFDTALAGIEGAMGIGIGKGSDNAAENSLASQDEANAIDNSISNGTFGIDGTSGTTGGTTSGGDESEGDGGGGSGAGGGSGSVICTELHRRGILSDSVYLADQAAGREYPPEVIAGYHLWGVPFARLMRTSPAAFAVGRFLGVAWATEMGAARGVPGARSTALGRALVAFGPPLCSVIGRLIRRRSAVAA